MAKRKKAPKPKKLTKAELEEANRKLTDKVKLLLGQKRRLEYDHHLAVSEKVKLERTISGLERTIEYEQEKNDLLTTRDKKKDDALTQASFHSQSLRNDNKELVERLEEEERKQRKITDQLRDEVDRRDKIIQGMCDLAKCLSNK